MANRLPPAEEIPFTMQIKNLADEELLDFWEETQQIESALRSEYQQSVIPVQDYERMIVLELQLRACQREKACGVWLRAGKVSAGVFAKKTSAFSFIRKENSALRAF